MFRATRTELIVGLGVLFVVVVGCVAVVVNSSRSTPAPTADRKCRTSADDLIRSADAGRLDGVRNRISGGVDVNAGDVNGFKPLYCAVAAGQAPTASALLDAGADPNLASTADDTTKNNALNIAVTINRSDLVTLLLDHRADPNATADGHAALNNAIEKQLPDMVALLLQRGSDPNQDDSHGPPLIYAAAFAPDARIPTLLLDHGADPNHPSTTTATICFDLAVADSKSATDSNPCRYPIGAAAMSGRRDTVAVLLDHGADPTAGVYGASSANRVDIARLLFERGGSPNPPTTTSPLLYSVFFDNVDMIQLLVERNADVNRGGPGDSTTIQSAMFLIPALGPTTPDSGRGLKTVVCGLQGSATNIPPLVAAAAIGDIRVVQLLLDHGADPNLVADFTTPVSPLSAAVLTHRDDVAELLRSRGATKPSGSAAQLPAATTSKPSGC